MALSRNKQEIKVQSQGSTETGLFGLDKRLDTITAQNAKCRVHKNITIACIQRDHIRAIGALTTCNKSNFT